MHCELQRLVKSTLNNEIRIQLLQSAFGTRSSTEFIHCLPVPPRSLIMTGSPPPTTIINPKIMYKIYIYRKANFFYLLRRQADTDQIKTACSLDARLHGRQGSRIEPRKVILIRNNGTLGTEGGAAGSHSDSPLISSSKGLKTRAMHHPCTKAFTLPRDDLLRAAKSKGYRIH